MSGRTRKPEAESSKKAEITILLVDDIAETRESVKKLLSFEPDMKVVGSAGTGREGVKLAKELRPDIIIMDINMPDMDGLEATSIIGKEVPSTAVIIMSVQNDTDYVRKAMRAGASDFLTKPVNIEETCTTIRTVYKEHAAERQRAATAAVAALDQSAVVRHGGDEEGGGRYGHIIVVYSPQGGAGTTTIATSVASGLMREGVKVLLVDADLQFADVATFLNIQPKTSVVDLIEDLENIDLELFESVVITHESGLRVLVGPGRPEAAEEIIGIPGAVGRILEQVATNYDFVVVDTSCTLNESTLSLFDRATRILMVTTPTLVALRHVRFLLEIFDEMSYENDKAMIVINRVWDEKRGKGATVPTEKIAAYLKREVVGAIPAVDETVLLRAINKGVPIIASDRNQSNPPIKQLVELSESLYQSLIGEHESEIETNKRKGIFSR